MAIVVTAPETVNDADINELYALEKHLMIISEGDPDNVYCGEGDDTILEEALLGHEDMFQSSLNLSSLQEQFSRNLKFFSSQ